jgi:hypothetical protein
MTTATVVEKPDIDCYIKESSTTLNHGASTGLKIWRRTSFIERALIKVVMPSKPAGAGKISKTELHLYESSYDAAATILAYELDSSFIEGTGDGAETQDGATWNTYNGVDNWDVAGGDYTKFIALTKCAGAVGWKKWDISELNLDWDESTYIILKFSVEDATDNEINFRSSDYTTNVEEIPKVMVHYEDALPTPITDLNIIPDPEKKTQPKITWKANEDEDFLRYKLYRGFRTSGTNNLATTILNQGEVSWIDDTVTWTQGSTIYYRMYVDDATNKTTGGTFGGQGSNIPNATRPTSILGLISDWTPNSWEEITAYVRGSGGTLKKAFYDWGDEGEGWTTATGTAYYERTHTYTKATTITFKHRTENTDGFQSDLTTAGSTIVVADIAPEAVIRASPPRHLLW